MCRRATARTCAARCGPCVARSMPAVPRISVVVPIYNVEGFLRECLESVAAQTVDDLEVVMVDDGSTDGSAAIAQEFAARDTRFRLLSQANGGLRKAPNTGSAAVP